MLSRGCLFATPWTVARQAPPSMGFSRQEYWSGVPFPSPGDLPDPGIEPGSPVSRIAGRFFTTVPPRKPKVKVAQSCLTLCHLMDYTARGILQARILEWVAFPFSRGSSQPRDRTQVSCFAGGFFATVPPGKPRRDVGRPPLGCPPTPVTVWSTDREGAGWRVRAEQAAPVSTGNSVLPATSRVNQESSGVMRRIKWHL